mgnify:CR=1 FL=1
MNAVARAIPVPAPAPTPATLAGWALLIMDGLTLALPQRDIVTIELTTALQPAGHDGNEIGWLVQNAQRWPVYSLDRHCALALTLAESVRVCVLLKSEKRTFGLAGTQISLLADDADLSVPPLPACLARPGSPFMGLALHNDVIVAVAHAQALADYLASLEAVYDD